VKRLISNAPGRICLFGDHQDYLGLPIIACAIDKYIKIDALPNGQKASVIRMPDIEMERILNFEDYLTDGVSSKEVLKENDHFVSALRVVQRYGCYPKEGFDIMISGNVPINAGLSSSSALVVGWVQFLLKTYGCDHEITPTLIGQLAYEAEVIEHNSPGGKMDQYSSAVGGIFHLRTDLSEELTPIETTLGGLIIGESGIPKNTLGLLGNLKSLALNAISQVQKKHPNFDLVSATMDTYEHCKDVLDTEQATYFYAAIKNHEITQKAFFALREKVVDSKHIGALMSEHHQVLKDVLRITVPRIDVMVEAALTAGAYGAKIVGSGGGGSICALAPEGKEKHIIQAIKNAGAVDAYAVQISKGAYIE
jgi:galactokinase